MKGRKQNLSRESSEYGDDIPFSQTHPEPLNTPALCSGYGARFSQANTGRDYPGVTWLEIISMARTPPDVEKSEAKWVIPSFYKRSDARKHSVQTEKGFFWALGFDIDSGNHSLERLNDVCGHVFGWEHAWVIYSSKSSRPEGKKWRVIVPLGMHLNGADYKPVTAGFSALLAELGIETDEAAHRPGQPLYLPNRGDFYEYKVNAAAKAVNQAFLVSSLVSVWEEAREGEAEHEALAQLEKDNRARKQVLAPRRGDGIADFNRSHDIHALLLQYGYTRQGSRYKPSDSGSGSHGVTVTAEGKALSSHQSDVQRGLGRVGANGAVLFDAFDLYCCYEHGNDRNAALKALGGAV